MPLADSLLQEKLRAFTKRIVSSLPYQEAIAVLSHPNENGDVEYEGNELDPYLLTFSWEVLCVEDFEGQPCARLLTRVCDDRENGMGSFRTPLCGGGWLFPDGKFENHSLGNFAASDEEFDA